MPPVPIWKGMNGDESVMNADRDLVGRMDSFFDPIASVSQETAEAYVSLLGINSDVLIRSSIGSGPSPYVAEHSLVQLEHELFYEELAMPELGRPRHSFIDVNLLGLIEVGTRRNPRLSESLALLRCEGGTVLRLGEQIIH